MDGTRISMEQEDSIIGRQYRCQSHLMVGLMEQRRGGEEYLQRKCPVDLDEVGMENLI